MQQFCISYILQVSTFWFSLFLGISTQTSSIQHDAESV